jgi:predicted ribosome quality control (RQC) complex YloA/Tae2 family protein
MHHALCPKLVPNADRQYMDFPFLANVVNELALLLVDARVERVYQGTSGGIYVLLQRDRKKFILLLSPDRSLPRLHLVSDKPAADTTPRPFILYLRSHLTGARVVQIALLNQDRIVEIVFAKQDAEYRLVFELIGTAANLILTDSSSKILAIYYLSALSENPVRTLAPGFQYALPDKKRIRKSINDLPNIAADSPNREAEAFYQRLNEQRTLSLVRQELQSCLRKALSKIERRVAALSRDLQSLDHAEKYRQAGDLVLANLDQLKTGMEEVNLVGYDGVSVALRLDPKLSPARNVERFFKKYKKAKAGHAIIMQRLHQAEEEAFYLKSLQSSVERAQDERDLIEVRSALIAKGYIKSKEREKVPVQPAMPYRTVLFRDWEILVGKGAKGNDHISTKIARPDDLWLHAEGMPGSHVLVKNPEKKEIPADVLVKAAALAAYYSKGKAAGKVSVTYTRAGLVKKPRGAKPGLVTITERKSIMVRPEEG